MNKVLFSFLNAQGHLPSTMTIWQSDCPGLGRRFNRGVLSKDGELIGSSEVWVIKYWFVGKQVLKTIANTEYMTKDQARTLVFRMKALAKQKIDPTFLISSFISDEAIHASTMRFKEFAEIYIERHAREHKKSWYKDRQFIDGHLKVWHNRPLNQIKRQDASDLHYKIGKKGKVTANRVIEVVSTMFNKAVEWGFLPDGYPNPTKSIKRNDEFPRDRFVEDFEFPKLGAALQAYPKPKIRAAIKLYLYTALRSFELIKLEWEWVKLNRNMIEIPGQFYKTGKKHRLPLSPPAIKLLLELQKGSTSRYVFPSKNGKSHISRIDKDWRKIRASVGLGDVNLHDLRHTSGHIIAEQTGNIMLVGKVLGHTQAYTSEKYGHIANKSVQGAVDSLALVLAEFLEPANH